MKLFFDILLYVSFFVSIPLFIIGVKRFPNWVASIDPAKCKSNKPLEEYLGNQLLLREGKFALMVLPCAAVNILSIQLGSMPKEDGEIGLLFLFPFFFSYILFGFGGLWLGDYFVKAASKCEVFQKAKNHGAFIHDKVYWGTGLLICFYFSLIIFFTFWHLFYVLGVI